MKMVVIGGSGLIGTKFVNRLPGGVASLSRKVSRLSTCITGRVG